MGTSGTRCDGPVPLSALLDDAAKRMPSAASAPLHSDGFLFSGNRHDSVPRRLLLDTRLTPLERNAWQVFRLLLNDDGITAFPTYEALRPYLASMPCTQKASHETVARAITLLRLTRWLSLARRRRDPKSGRIQGNLYVLHDEPLTPFEAMQLDPDYLGLVSQALTHASKAVQRVGVHTLKEIAEDPLLSGRSLPTRLQVLTRRLAGEHTGDGSSYPQASDVAQSEEGEDALLRNAEDPSSESELGPKPAPDGMLRNPKQDRTVRKKRMYEVRTVPRTREAKDAQQPSLPRRFQTLKSEQQAGALVTLQQVETSLRQAVLDEWDARCRTSTIRNPAGYLFGIIQKAIRGEFKAWVGQHSPGTDKPVSPPHEAAPSPAPPPADPDVVHQHIEHLRSLLRMS
ncbi:MAG: STY4528 family pathogenicity island replication protein [Rhodocyclaceae bacterium]